MSAISGNCLAIFLIPCLDPPTSQPQELMQQGARATHVAQLERVGRCVIEASNLAKLELVTVYRERLPGSSFPFQVLNWMIFR